MEEQRGAEGGLALRAGVEEGWLMLRVEEERAVLKVVKAVVIAVVKLWSSEVSSLS